MVGIELHAIGGRCLWQGTTGDEKTRAVIAWGGILGQAILFVVALGLEAWVPPSSIKTQIVVVWTLGNVLIGLFNLLPLRGLDGAEAWCLLRWRYVSRFFRRGKLHVQTSIVERRLRSTRESAAAKADRRWN